MSNTITKPRAVAPSEFEAELVKMLAGFQTVFPANGTLTIGGAVETLAVMVAKLQGWIGNSKAVDTAKQAYMAAVAARLAEVIEARTWQKDAKAALKLKLGNQNPALASFGIATDKPIQTTAQQKLVASAKRSQTRKVRGTKGKKQRAAITVVGNPEIHIASDGTKQISPPPVNLPAPTGTGSDGGTPSGGSTPPTK